MKYWILNVLALLLALPSIAIAEQSVKFGDIEVHYNALITNDLLPEVARSYGLDRSKSRGLVTMAVLKKSEAGIAAPIKATLKVSTVTPTAMAIDVPIREVNEHTAIYYIGTFRISGQETLKFVVDVKPEGGAAQKFEFKKTFYPD